MSGKLALNGTGFYNPYMASSKNQKHQGLVEDSNYSNYQSYETPADGSNMLLNSLMSIASQNGINGINGVNGTSQNSAVSKDKVAEMLQAGNKQEVKDKMGAAAVPALMAIVKDTSQPMNVRVDAIATLAKLVDEGKAPASCLVQLLKDPNSKDMAERALANVGKEAMPVVKQLLKSGDPAMQQSAKNILNDMVDAWSGYENDPKWGAECKELLPEVNAMLNKINNNDNNDKTTNSNTSTNNEDDKSNKLGITRQFVEFARQTI